jgi:serine protease
MEKGKIMKNLYLILGIAIAFVIMFGQKGLANDQILERQLAHTNGQGHAPDEIIVKFKPGVSQSVIDNINREHGTTVIYTSPFAGFKRFKIPKGRTAEQMVEILSKNPNVEYTELNYIAYTLMVPNDPLYSYQWHLDNPVNGGINMEPAWDIATGGGVIVAVIDTGVAYENYSEGSRRWKTQYSIAPDLADTSFVPGYDFVNNDTHPDDDEGHGTHVTGTIAQSTNNGLGVAGVAFGCSIMPIKVLNKNGSGTYTAIADGIYYAADHGADVINMSLGGSSGSITLENAVAYAYGHGVTIVCASGNDGQSTVSYPAAYDNYCIAVGATNYAEQVTGYSNGGSSLDLTAPGGDGHDYNGDGYMDGVLQQTHDGTNYSNFSYWFYTGTSMATPHVSGVAALVISHGNASTPDEVREALESTAKDKGPAGWDSEYGWGIVDAYAALQWVSGPIDNPPTVTITNPADDAIISGSITVTADAADDNGVTKVEFFVNGSSIGVDNTSPYGVSWNSASVVDGSYTVSATATDTAGKTGSYIITVTVDNIDSPPIVAIVYPQEGSTVSGVIDVVADAIDDKGVTQVEFFVDGGSIGVDSDGSDGWSASWDTTAYGDGSHTISATATDTSFKTDSDSITVTVNNSISLRTMYVGSIIMDLKKAGPNVNGMAKITILAADDYTPVAGATVYGHWSDATSDSDFGTTDSLGTITLQSDKIKKPSSGTKFTFTVDDVVKSGWVYDAPVVAPSASISVP